MKLVLTTISQGKVAIIESTEEADKKKGEKYISEDCLNTNIESGNFQDLTHTGANPEGRIYVMTSDLSP
jgi:hypothetical protein